MDFSPQIANLDVVQASLSSWTPVINIKTSDITPDVEQTLSLHRVVDFGLIFYFLSRDKTFIGMTINKLYTNTIEYKIQAVLKWINSAGKQNQIERVLEKGRDWCLATPNVGFPTDHRVSLIWY